MLFTILKNGTLIHNTIKGRFDDFILFYENISNNSQDPAACLSARKQLDTLRKMKKEALTKFRNLHDNINSGDPNLIRHELSTMQPDMNSYEVA